MKKILFMLPVLAACLVSCDKGDGNENNGGTSYLVKTISGYSDDWSNDDEPKLCTVSFEYDGSGRMLKSIYDMGDYGVCQVTTYEYGADEIIEEFWYAPDVGEEMVSDGYTRYVLNDGGYVTREEWYDGEGTSLGYRTFVYDNGYVRKSIDDESRYEYTYEWNNGNIVRVTEMDHSYNSEHIVSYAYGNEDKANIFGWYDYHGPWSMISGLPETYLPFKGMKNRQLMVSKTIYYESGQMDSGNSRKFYYQYDSSGRVTEATLEQDGRVEPYNICTVTYF